ncbi:Inositol polyphosphate 1-phosphatase [Gryllus bimaculatus]|nr:Inositol polyphosphate 1-phosphatase [Gryllus bimaculatus]
MQIEYPVVRSAIFCPMSLMSQVLSVILTASQPRRGVEACGAKRNGAEEAGAGRAGGAGRGGSHAAESIDGLRPHATAHRHRRGAGTVTATSSSAERKTSQLTRPPSKRKKPKEPAGRRCQPRAPSPGDAYLFTRHLRAGTATIGAGAWLRRAGGPRRGVAWRGEARRSEAGVRPTASAREDPLRSAAPRRGPGAIWRQRAEVSPCARRDATRLGSLGSSVFQPPLHGARSGLRLVTQVTCQPIILGEEIMTMAQFLKSLIKVSVKAANIARFPNIASHIKGEENNSFSNVLGESITVAIQENEADTAALLTQVVLNGDTTAGGLLAAEVHKAVLVDYQSLNVDRIPDDLTLPVVVLSSSESSDLKERLTERGYLVVEAAGAGYKCLVVALGQADAYLLSRGTTYRWDICGPHALLLAQNGGIIQFVPAEQGSIQEISYLETDDDKSEGINQWCNKDGVIAYRNAQFLGEIVHLLKKS